MVDRDLLDAFDDCIDRLGHGQTVDDCLRRYPQYAPALRPLLEIGLLTRRVDFSSTEVSSAQERVRARYRQAIRTIPIRQHNTLRWMRLVASVLMVLVLAMGGLGLAAESSIPGDPLYNVKLFTENVRLLFSNDNALRQQFSQRRVNETRQLVALRREAEVIFEGEITVMDARIWQIAGLPVRVEVNTPGVGTLVVNDRVRVRAKTTAQGEIVALEIRLLATRLPETTPTSIPTITVTDMPTAARQPSKTPTLSSTPSATITDTPTLNVTRAPETEVTGCSPRRPDGWLEYAIQRGDTLSGLAVRAGITLKRLIGVNCLSVDMPIVVGQRIYLPRTVTRPSPTPQVTRQAGDGGRDTQPTSTPDSGTRPRG